MDEDRPALLSKLTAFTSFSPDEGNLAEEPSHAQQWHWEQVRMERSLQNSEGKWLQPKFCQLKYQSSTRTDPTHPTCKRSQTNFYQNPPRLEKVSHSKRTQDTGETSTEELRKPAMSLMQRIPGQMEAVQCPSCSGSLQPQPAHPGTWPRFLPPLGRAGFILSICWWCFYCKPWGPCSRHLPPREVWLWCSWQLQKGSGWMQRQKWQCLMSFQS